jgi:hypothetical protein
MQKNFDLLPCFDGWDKLLPEGVVSVLKNLEELNFRSCSGVAATTRSIRFKNLSWK